MCRGPEIIVEIVGLAAVRTLAKKRAMGHPKMRTERSLSQQRQNTD